MKTKQPLGPNQTKWVEALESGEYEQGFRFLCRNGRYCALGVACEALGLHASQTKKDELVMQFGRGSDASASLAPQELIDLLALRGNDGDFLCRSDAHGESITEANDDLNLEFPEIASFIRENPEQVFTEPR